MTVRAAFNKLTDYELPFNIKVSRLYNAADPKNIPEKELKDTAFRRTHSPANPHTYGIEFQLSQAEFHTWKHYGAIVLGYQLDVTLHGQHVAQSPYELPVRNPGFFDVSRKILGFKSP